MSFSDSDTDSESGLVKDLIAESDMYDPILIMQDTYGENSHRFEQVYRGNNLLRDYEQFCLSQLAAYDVNNCYSGILEVFYGYRSAADIVIKGSKSIHYRMLNTAKEPMPINFIHDLCRKSRARPRMELLSLTLDFYDITTEMGTSHYNMIVIDHVQKTFERFEPHGTLMVEIENVDFKFVHTSVDEFLDNVFRDEYDLEGYTYVPPDEYCPLIGPQHLEQVWGTDLFPMGACAYWSMLYCIERVMRPDLDRREIIVNWATMDTSHLIDLIITFELIARSFLHETEPTWTYVKARNLYFRNPRNESLMSFNHKGVYDYYIGTDLIDMPTKLKVFFESMTLPRMEDRLPYIAERLTKYLGINLRKQLTVPVEQPLRSDVYYSLPRRMMQVPSLEESRQLDNKLFDTRRQFNVPAEESQWHRSAYAGVFYQRGDPLPRPPPVAPVPPKVTSVSQRPAEPLHPELLRQRKGELRQYLTSVRVPERGTTKVTKEKRGYRAIRGKRRTPVKK